MKPQTGSPAGFLGTKERQSVRDHCICRRHTAIGNQPRRANRRQRFHVLGAGRACRYQQSGWVTRLAGAWRRNGPGVGPSACRGIHRAPEKARQRADRVIDKIPDNILYLGLVAILFSSARIIFCRRNRRDVSRVIFFALISSFPGLTIWWICGLRGTGHRVVGVPLAPRAPDANADDRLRNPGHGS